jgi:hypothetical protein
MQLRSSRVFSASLVAVSLAACTSGQVGQYPVTHVNPVTSSTLQFGVGWLTGYPASQNNPEYDKTGYGINLVETLRQSNGRSALLSDSVEVDVPSALGAQLQALDPPVNGIATNNITLAAPLAAYGAGINQGTLLLNSGFNPLNGSGGPPAFPPPADVTSLTQGFWEGYYATFPIVPLGMGDAVGLPLATAQKLLPGGYTLNVTVPTGAASTELISKSATLSGKPLPAFAPPAVTPDGTGGALVSIVVPAGVTETIVSVVANACQVQSSSGATPAPVIVQPETYTLVSHRAGPGTDRLTLPDFVTPIGGLGTYQSICSSAESIAPTAGYLAYAAGFDYPAFESVYPQSFSQTPAIVGAAGEPDITVSSPTSFVTP